MAISPATVYDNNSGELGDSACDVRLDHGVVSLLFVQDGGRVNIFPITGVPVPVRRVLDAVSQEREGMGEAAEYAAEVERRILEEERKFGRSAITHGRR